MSGGGLKTQTGGKLTAYHATIQKIGVFQLWVKANFPIIACKINNIVEPCVKGGYTYKDRLDCASRANEKYFETTPSRMSESALLASRTETTLVVDP